MPFEMMPLMAEPESVVLLELLSLLLQAVVNKQTKKIKQQTKICFFCNMRLGAVLVKFTK